MWKATWKGLLAYRLRLALTGMAIVLGVAFVTGTYVLTDTLNAFFDEAFSTSLDSVDVVIQPTAVGGAAGGMGSTNFVGTERLPGELVGIANATPGVLVAEGQVSGTAQMLDKKGKLIGGMGPPTLGFSFGEHAEYSPFRIREGKPPHGANEVAIDVVTAKRFHYKVGERIKVLPRGPVQEFTISALIGFGNADNLGGATFAVWDTPTAQRLLGRQDGYDFIAVVAEDGVSAGQLVERLEPSMPKGVQVQTATQNAADRASDIKQSIGFIGTAILFFAGIALFVGAFIIANTFSIILAQRARELALLRALGASRSQVLASVMLEALIVGVFASIIGLGVGVLVGAGLRAIVQSIGGGANLPGSAIGIRPRTIVIGLTVGTVTTLISALVPAIRGSRQAPVAALREVQPIARRFSRRRVVGGAIATLIGVLFLWRGLFGSDVPLRFGVIGLGAMGIFMGVSLLSPLAAGYLSRVIGAPIAAVYGVTGRLARENAARNPQRTASTAAALMVGLAVVTTVAVMGSSIKASANKVLDEGVRAAVMVREPSGSGFTPEVEQRLAAVEGVDGVTSFRLNQFSSLGKQRLLAGVVASGPDMIDRAMSLDLAEGTTDGLGDGGMLMHEDVATKLGLRVGDTFEVTMPKATLSLPVEGIYRDRRVVDVSYIVSQRDYEAGYSEQLDLLSMVVARPGADPAQIVNRAKVSLKDFPNLTILDQAGFKKEQGAQVDQLLLLINALLALSILIAVLGIANTLALSVFERTRALGLLRAVGMGRRQMRRMIRWESVVIAVLGAVLGSAVGLGFGWVVVQALRDDGVEILAVPVGLVVILVFLSGLAGMGAAIFPARRAGRLDILAAIASE